MENQKKTKHLFSKVRTSVATAMRLSVVSIAIIAGGYLRAAAAEFGLLSESIPGLNFGVDGELGKYSGSNDTYVPTTTDNYADYREISRSIQTSMFSPTGGWSGWFIQYGVGTSPAIKPMSAYSNGSIRFWFKGESSLSPYLQVGIRSGNIPAGSETSKVFLNAYTTFDNNWHSVSIPVSVFIQREPRLVLDAMKVLINFSVEGNTFGTHNFWIDNLRWDTQQPGALSTITVTPNPASVPAGSSELFTATGRDGSNARIDIWPTWTKSAGLASSSFANTTGDRTTFIAGGSLQSGTITASYGGRNGTANVNVTAGGADKFGVLSETYPGVLFGTDAEIGLDNGGGAPAVVLNGTYTADVVEGVNSMRTAVGQSQGYAGWFVQHGLLGSADTVVKDMSHYAAGSIRFWLKAPSALNGVLTVGVRSGNVPAGAETSKVVLNSTYYPFDNTWKSVTLPLSLFIGPSPKADLSQIKVFFSVFAIGTTNGSHAFLIDNLRWDTETPGALASLTVTPNNVSIPFNTERQFTAAGTDASGVSIDIWPTWSMPSGSLGTLSATSGPTVKLLTGNTEISGVLRAQVSGFTANSNVTVGNVTYTQSYNVYSDAGSGGYVGASQGPAGSTIVLSQQNDGTAPEGSTFRRSVYTLKNTPGEEDAYALWFTEAELGSRFMPTYESGYLHFFVRTNRDLQFGIRSENVAPGAEQSKMRLSELGVPLDNTWREVLVPLETLADRDPNFDFAQVKVFFSIGAVSAQIGEVTNAVFDVDDVRWLTTDPGVIEDAKLYQDLVMKQRPSGLVRSFDTLPQAVTYDQALAAMNFTYYKDLAKAKSIFETYRTNLYQPGQGLADEYHVDTLAVRDADRLVGPNAWFVLALMHYRNVSGDTAYDGMIDGLAAWLKSMQAPDGAMRFGNSVNGVDINTKATEFSFDCYAVFEAYASLRGDATYRTAAQNIWNWLLANMWRPSENRFYVGMNPNGTPNTDKALDVYSWAPLALSSFSVVLTQAEVDLGTSAVNDLTGRLVDGFDFGGPLGQAPDKDAVWLEGTGQMAAAYFAYGDTQKANYYLEELKKAVVTNSPSSQGIPYATNAGTGYAGFIMDSLHPAVSSVGWYLFARNRFNPFKPFPLNTVKIKNISNSAPAAAITWTANLPAGWVRANQYIEVDAQPVSLDPWGIQIYTDNTNPSMNPRFVDPTPELPNNHDSNPAGMLMSGSPTTFRKVPLAWSIKDRVADAPSAAEPSSGAPDSFQWLIMKDRATPAVDNNNNGLLTDPTDTTPFVDGEDFIRIRDASGVHGGQGPLDYFPALTPDFVFLQADFSIAAAQTDYTTRIILEFFNE